MECLKEIVGITALDCSCTTGALSEEQTANLKRSTSGFYLDQIPDAVNMRAIKDLDSCKKFYDLAIGARDTAITTLADDITAALALKYKKSKQKYIGTIGRIQYAGSIQAKKPLQFIKLDPGKVSDGVISLKKVRVYSTGSGSSKFYIYSAISGEDLQLVKEIDFILVANNAATVPVANPILLPLDVNGKAVAYYLAWEAPEGVNPKDNKVDCSCNAGKGSGFAEYVAVTGGEAADLVSMEAAKHSSSSSRGIVLDVDINCGSSSFVCREYNSQDGIAIVAKWAVAYKANEILIESILSSPEVNRYTMMSREHLYGKRNHFRAEYDNRVQYILENIDITKSDCFICKQNTIQIGGILA